MDKPVGKIDKVEVAERVAAMLLGVQPVDVFLLDYDPGTDEYLVRVEGPMQRRAVFMPSDGTHPDDVMVEDY